MEFQVSIDQMKSAFRMAEKFKVENNPYGTPAYPYVWRVHPARTDIRLEMGRTEKTTLADSRRIIAVFSFQPLGVGEGVGVRVHISVWLVSDGNMDDWSARHSVNTNYHMAALGHFKTALLQAPGMAFVVAVPEEVPLPKDEERPQPPT